MDPETAPVNVMSPAPTAAAPAAAPVELEVSLPEVGKSDFNLKDFDTGSVAAPAKVGEDGEPLPVDALQEDDSSGLSDDSGKDGEDPAALAAAEAAELRRENEAMKARLEALENQRKPEEAKPEDKVEARGPDKEPDPQDYEFGAADERYLTDLAVFRTDQRINERERQAELRSEVQALEHRWNDTVSSDEISSKYPDFAEKVTAGADKGTWDCSIVGTIFIKESPVGPDIAYHLASDPAESKRIAALAPQEQVRELSRLEGRYQYAAEMSSNPAPKPRLASNAPPPPIARARGQGGKFSSDENSTYKRMLSEFR